MHSLYCLLSYFNAGVSWRPWFSNGDKWEEYAELAVEKTDILASGKHKIIATIHQSNEKFKFMEDSIYTSSFIQKGIT